MTPGIRAEDNLELARRLAAAFIGHQMGISLNWALKHYVSDHPGSYWLALAERVRRETSEIIDKQLTDAREFHAEVKPGETIQ